MAHSHTKEGAVHVDANPAVPLDCRQEHSRSPAKDSPCLLALFRNTVPPDLGRYSSLLQSFLVNLGAVPSCPCPQILSRGGMFQKLTVLRTKVLWHRTATPTKLLVMLVTPLHIHARGNAVDAVVSWLKTRSFRFYLVDPRYHTPPEGALFEGVTLFFSKTFSRRTGSSARPSQPQRLGGPNTSRVGGPPSVQPSLSPSPLFGGG